MAGVYPPGFSPYAEPGMTGSPSRGLNPGKGLVSVILIQPKSSLQIQEGLGVNRNIVFPDLIMEVGR
jgi:hypothetical protein